MKRTAVLFCTLFLACSFVFANGQEEQKATQTATKTAYPQKDIQFIVPFPIGGSTGTPAQELVLYLDKYFPNVNVVLNSMTGSGGSTGARYIKGQKPDGYNYLVAVPGYAVQKALNNLDFTFRDFEQVAGYASSPQVLVVRKDSKYKTFNDFISDAKQNPGKVLFGAPMGTSLFMGVIAMENELDVKFNVVDIGGVSVKAPELLSGRVDAYLDSTAKTIPYIKSGDFRALAVWGTERSDALPDVPTLKECGFQTMLEEAAGIWAPKGTPQDIIDTMSTAIKTVTEDPGFKAEFRKLSTQVAYKDPATYRKFLEDYEKTVDDVASKLN